MAGTSHNLTEPADAVKRPTDRGASSAPNRRIRDHAYVRDLRTFPTAAVHAFRRQGAAGVWWEVRKRVLYRLARWGRLLVVEQDLACEATLAAPAGVRIEPLPTEAKEVLEAMAHGVTLRRLRRAAARGRICLVAWRGERPVGYVWYAETSDPDLDMVRLPLPPGAVSMNDLYVVPEERNAGLGTALVAALVLHARSLGHRLGWRTLALENRATRRILDRTAGAAARSVGEIRYARVLGWSHARFRATPQPGPLPPPVGPS